MYHWQVEKYNWIGASWNTGVALKTATGSVAERCQAPCGFDSSTWWTEHQKPASFSQGCLKTFLLWPITYLTMINRTLVHFCLICYSLSEYTQTPRLQSWYRLQPTQKTSAGKLCTAGAPGRKCSESWVTQPHQARECSSLSGLALFVCLSFSTIFPPSPIYLLMANGLLISPEMLRSLPFDMHTIQPLPNAHRWNDWHGSLSATVQIINSPLTPSLYRKQFSHEDVWMAFF